MSSIHFIFEMRIILPLTMLFAMFSITTSWAEQQGSKILYDPGPNHLCYSYTDLTKTDHSSVYSDFSHCQAIGVPAGPAWTFSWFNSDVSFNGFDVGKNSQPTKVTLINNAEGYGNCDSAIEPSLQYNYPGFAIKKLNQDTGQQYDLSQFDQWIVEYDVTVHRDNTTCPNCPGCGGYNRKYLTTDFIYYWSQCDGCPAIKNLISIVHYNPIPTHARLGPYEEAGGYRIQINGPPTLVEGQKSHVAIDFREILLRYSTELCHSGRMPYYPTLYSLQIVSSNVNTSSTIDIENVQLSLRKTPDTTKRYPMPTYPSGRTPGYCPVQSQTPNNTTCYTGRNAN